MMRTTVSRMNHMAKRQCLSLGRVSILCTPTPTTSPFLPFNNNNNNFFNFNHNNNNNQQQQQLFHTYNQSQQQQEQQVTTEPTNINNDEPNTQTLMIHRLNEIIKNSSIPLWKSPTTSSNTSSSDATSTNIEEQDQLLTIILNLTHETRHESRKCEHMGRSILKMCCADYLYAHFGNMSALQMESVLNQFTSALNLMETSRSLQLNTVFSPHEQYVEIDVTDENTMDVGVRGHERMVTGTLLRLIGAIYFVNGLYVVRRFISSHILSRSVDISSLLESFDPVKDLKELLRSGQMREHAYEQLIFETVNLNQSSGNSGEDGGASASSSQSSLVISGDLITVHARVRDSVIGVGSGYTKKIAEMRAAQDALNKHYTKYDSRMTPIQLEQRLFQQKQQPQQQQ